MQPPTNPGLAQAKAIAKRVHRDQRDKTGAPYIGHPARVADNVAAYPFFESEYDRETALVAAWLHDVIEDSAEFGEQVTADDLLAAQIPFEVVEVVELLTFTPSPHHSLDTDLQIAATKFADKLAYYAAIAANPVARLVKICDLADNCNLERVEAMRRLSKDAVNPDKYPLALAALNLSPKEWTWFNERIRLGMSL